MRLKILLPGRAKTATVSAATVAELLQKIGMNPETVIVSVNGNIVPEQTKLKKSDKVDVLRVVSGG
ncbi:MAG: sulfur carrier protein ThiS [Candidatus Aenigmatarchaeota archaeon]